MPPSKQKKAHKAHFFNKKALQREREISSAYHSTTYLNIVCIGTQQNVMENSGIFLLKKILILTFSGSGRDFS